MQDGLEFVGFLGPDIVGIDHERCRTAADEVFLGGRLEYRRRERPPLLTVFDEPVDPVARRGGAGVGEDAPGTERSRPHLQPSLEPADEVAVGEPFGDVSLEVVRFSVLEFVRF